MTDHSKLLAVVKGKLAEMRKRHTRVEGIPADAAPWCWSCRDNNGNAQTWPCDASQLLSGWQQRVGRIGARLVAPQAGEPAVLHRAATYHAAVEELEDLARALGEKAE